MFPLLVSFPFLPPLPTTPPVSPGVGRLLIKLRIQFFLSGSASGGIKHKTSQPKTPNATHDGDLYWCYLVPISGAQAVEQDTSLPWSGSHTDNYWTNTQNSIKEEFTLS